MLARIAALVAIGMMGCGSPQRTTVMNLCDLSRDFAVYRGRLVAVRGVYFNGLRQQCRQSCATGPWPSFVDLIGNDRAGDAIWAGLANAERTAVREAKQGRRFEVWVTVTGRIGASDHRSPVGPCDVVVNGGYGHLGAFPAQIVVEAFNDIKIVPNTDSPYDYSRVRRSAL
jgi:hypothetical protein